MAKYVEIKSYAHAEELGLKPNDSMVGKVIDISVRTKPFRVVGYSGLSDFTPGDVTFDPRIKEYLIFPEGADDPEEPIKIHAIDTRMAKRLAKDALNKGVKFDIYLQKRKTVKV